MAVFNNTPEEKDRLDWQIMQNGWICLYWQERILDRDLDWLKKEKYTILDMDCTSWTDENRIHKALKKQLDFPDYYGENFNALEDCLSDLVIQETGLVIVFRRFQLVDNDIAHRLLDSFACNARLQSLFGKRMLTLVQVDDPNYKMDPVGSSSVLWNPAEWLDSNRSR